MLFCINPYAPISSDIYAYSAGYFAMPECYDSSFLGSMSGADSLIWNGACAVGRMSSSISGMGGIFGGGLGNYIRGLSRRAIAHARHRHPAKRKQLPTGTDNKNPAVRGRAYLRDHVGIGRQMPTQQDVIKNIFGPPPMDNPEALARYRAAVEEFKKGDNAMRTVVKDVVGSWMNDPVARTEFVRRWGMARNSVEMARALFDPKDDGSFIRVLSQFVEGLNPNARTQSEQDANWEKVARWFGDNLGGGTIPNMGDEAYDIAMSRGINQSSPADQKTSIDRLVTDGGYMPEEAEMIMRPVGTMEEADALTRYLTTYSSNGPAMKQNTSQIKDMNEKLASAQKNFDEKNEKLKAGGLSREDKARTEGQVEQYRRDIEGYKTELKSLHKQRAEYFLEDYARFVRMFYNMEPENFGYKAGTLPDGVTDVPSAAKEAYRWLGVDVDMPAGWRANEEKELPETEKGKAEGTGGKGKPKPVPNQTPSAPDPGQDYIDEIELKGYLAEDAWILKNEMGIEDPSNLPTRDEFNEAYARAKKFKDTFEVREVLAKDPAKKYTYGQVSEVLDNPKAPISNVKDLIDYAADVNRDLKAKEDKDDPFKDEQDPNGQSIP